MTKPLLNRGMHHITPQKNFLNMYPVNKIKKIYTYIYIKLEHNCHLMALCKEPVQTLYSDLAIQGKREVFGWLVKNSYTEPQTHVFRMIYNYCTYICSPQPPIIWPPILLYTAAIRDCWSFFFMNMVS